MNGESNKESDKKEENKAEKVAGPIIASAGIDDDMPSWQKQMWQEYTDDYSKQISDVCYNTEFKVLYNKVQSKGEEALLFTEPEWTPATLILKNMSALQTEHCIDLKAVWFKLTRQAAMTPKDYEKYKIPIPPNYMDLSDARQESERRYYEEASRIMFKLKLGNELPREMTLEDYHRLERVNAKFAIDAVQLSFSKPQPKKAAISPSLYT